MILQNWHISSSGQASQNDKPEKTSGFIWVHMDGTHPDTRQWLIDDPDIDSIATETLLTEDSRPRTIVHEDSLLINLRGVNLSQGSDITDMVGIRFIVTRNRIVSVERRPLTAIHNVAKQLELQLAPKTTCGFVAWFALTLAELMGPALTDISEKVDDFENDVDTDAGLLDRKALGALRRNIIALRRYLAPQRDALSSIALQSNKWISERDRLHMRSAADQTTRITEELDSLRERCAVIRDQLTDQRAEQMNKTMLILSVVAAIFLPLGLLSGMMGINVGGMPWTENDLGFWFVVALVTGIGFLQLLFFKLLKWI